MSYEGYMQCICTNGHYYTCDARDEGKVCGWCSSPAAWANDVDTTNIFSVGRISYEDLKRSFLISEEVIETCPHCKTTKLTKPAIFRIPQQTETIPLREYESEE